MMILASDFNQMGIWKILHFVFIKLLLIKPTSILLQHHFSLSPIDSGSVSEAFFVFAQFILQVRFVHNIHNFDENAANAKLMKNAKKVNKLRKNCYRQRRNYNNIDIKCDYFLPWLKRKSLVNQYYIAAINGFSHGVCMYIKFWFYVCWLSGRERVDGNVALWQTKCANSQIDCYWNHFKRNQNYGSSQFVLCTVGLYAFGRL